MKKILIILLTCFLITSRGLAQSNGNQERTKDIYRGSKYRPSLKITFYQVPELGTAWSAIFVEYKILGRVRYVGGPEYLTKKQHQDEDTVILNFIHTSNKVQLDILTIITLSDYHDPTSKERLYLVIEYYDTDLDGRPDYNKYGWRTNPFDVEQELFFSKEVTKIDIRWFKGIKKQINYKKIEKEFQEWLKENKQ